MNSYHGRGLHKDVVENLGRRIVQGDFTAYEPINLLQLEDDLGVSRTALREAIKVLAAKGMIEARQRRGTFVLPRKFWALLDSDVMRWEFTRTDTATMLANLAEVRDIVEPAIARIAAHRRTDAELSDMKAALDEMAQATDAAAMARADTAFHQSLAAATHNEMLVRIAALITIGLGERDHAVPVHASDPVPPHEAVLAAVAGGDAGRAEEAMRALLEVANADQAHVVPTDEPGPSGGGSR